MAPQAIGDAMATENFYPVQIQASNSDANDSRVACMCHVFDIAGEVTVFNALTKAYLHVMTWDKNGRLLQEYDNRAA